MMPNSEHNLTLGKTLSALVNSYKGFDVRAIIVKPKDKTSWICVFIKVRFTREDSNELQQKYNETEARVGIQDEECLKVKLGYYAIDKSHEFLQQLASGYINLADIECRIEDNSDQIQSNEVMNIYGGGYINSPEYSEYLHKMIVASRSDGFVTPHLENIVGKENVDAWKISELPDINNLQNVHANNIMIFFPIYSKKLELKNHDLGNILSKYEIDSSFASQCIVKLTIDGSQNERVNHGASPKLYRQIIHVKNHIINNMGSVSIVNIPMPGNYKISYKDFISLTILHTVIGWVCKDETFGAITILNPPYLIDPLIESFRQFVAFTRLYEYLHSNDDSKQVTGTSWLFAMMGLNPIQLGIVDKEQDEKIKASGVGYSCDIMLSNKTNIIAIDCTTSVPKIEKLTKIHNTAKYIKDKIDHDFNVISVVVSSEDCSNELKIIEQNSNVTIIDKKDIDKMYDQISNGLRTDAMLFFNDLTGLISVS